MNAREANPSPSRRKPAPRQEKLGRPCREPAETTVANGIATKTEDPISEEPEGEAPGAPDLSGWAPHPGERRDFYHRIRAFPPEVAGWRRRMVRSIADQPGRFPLASSATPEEIQGKLDDGISYLREVARILAALYGTPNLGNKPDPTDELV